MVYKIFCTFLDTAMLLNEQVALMFHKLVAAARTFQVKDVSKKEERKGRPVGLNTVNMLKVVNFLIDVYCKVQIQLN